MWKAMEKPSILFSNSGSIASGVTSRPVKPVPPVVTMASMPGSPGACRDGWDGILAAQLDYRTRPCNFVEIMPRLDEHLRRPKAMGASV